MDKKNKAIGLRMLGKSYGEINKILGIPKSTLSYWLSNIKLNKIAKEKIELSKYKKSTLKLIMRNKEQTVIARNRHQNAMNAGKKEFKIHKADPLFLVGLSLYWAEGYKKGASGSKWKVIDFANSDEQMIILILNFFRKYLIVDDQVIKAQLIAHPNINIKKAVNKWSEITNIPEEKFIKTYSGQPISSKGIRDKKSLPNGTIHIRIYQVEQFFRLIGWIEGLKEHFKE